MCVFCAGHVGVPVPCCMVKLIDVPELNYAVNNNQGEVINISHLKQLT